MIKIQPNSLEVFVTTSTSRPADSAACVTISGPGIGPPVEASASTGNEAAEKLVAHFAIEQRLRYMATVGAKP